MPSGPEDPAAYRRALDEQKRATTLEAVFRLARLLNDIAIERTRARAGASALRTAHTALLPHIDLEGTRLTTLAARVGITKQAIGQLLDDLEAEGVVERVPDPDDGRAKLVRFSRKGRAALLEGLALLRELEAELAGRLGRQRWRAFRETIFDLLALAPELDRSPQH